MTPLTIYQDNSYTITAVPNYFIDEYMLSANATQIKVYLYLLRTMGEGRSTSLCEIADFFDYPEKDIIRVLKYWEKQGLLAMDLDEQNQLTGIQIFSFPKTPVKESKTSKKQQVIISKVPEISTIPAENNESGAVTESDTQTEVIPISEAVTPDYVKKTCSLDELKAFKENDSITELLFVVETYLKRQLTGNDLQTIYFFIETLQMSVDLIDYLFQYCIERGKTDFHYIEKVAISWAENGIKTPSEAKDFSYKYAKIVYTVMKALGKSTVPTDEEASYVHTWSKDMGFTDDLILEACKRSVAGTDKNRLQYADTILKSWKSSQVITMKDVEKLDDEFKKRKSSSASLTLNYKKSSFHQFEHRNYNFDALEKQLRSN